MKRSSVVGWSGALETGIGISSILLYVLLFRGLVPFLCVETLWSIWLNISKYFVSGVLSVNLKKRRRKEKMLARNWCLKWEEFIKRRGNGRRAYSTIPRAFVEISGILRVHPLGLKDDCTPREPLPKLIGQGPPILRGMVGLPGMQTTNQLTNNC